MGMVSSRKVVITDASLTGWGGMLWLHQSGSVCVTRERSVRTVLLSPWLGCSSGRRRTSARLAVCAALLLSSSGSDSSHPR